MNQKHYITLIFFFVTLMSVSAQTKTEEDQVVQFSGVVVTEENGEIVPLGYTNIGVKGTSRGTSTEYDGFFSLAVKEGETMVFSRIGYQTAELLIPDTLTHKFYSVYQAMSRDTVWLPEAVIYPWPSREHFKIEFLAMNVKDELKERAMENLDAYTLAEMRETLPGDGRESGSLVLRQNAEANYSTGQFKPMNILNPLAWKKFIDAWKKGDFKKKKKEKEK